MLAIGESDAGALMFKREVDKHMKYLYFENRCFFSLQNRYLLLSVQKDFMEITQSCVGAG